MNLKKKEMTVEMLIDKLKQFNPETQVMIVDKSGKVHEWIMVDEFNNDQEALYSVEISFE